MCPVQVLALLNLSRAERADMSVETYSVGTWDGDEQAYTPQLYRGVEIPSINLTIHELRRTMKELREMGYSVHRFGNTRDSDRENDTSVLIEKTTGMSRGEVLESWKR